MKLFDIIENESGVVSKDAKRIVTKDSDNELIEESVIEDSESESEVKRPPDILGTALRTGKQSKKLRGKLNPNYSTSESSLSGDDVARERRPVNLFEFYKRINTPQRLAHMIVKFGLQDYIGAEEYEALSYFNPDEIPQEKAMLKPVRRAVLAMLAGIPIRRRKTSLQQVFEDKQEQEHRDFKTRQLQEEVRKQRHKRRTE